MLNYLSNLTPEQREENMKKAREAREIKKLAGAHLKNDFLDESHWRSLASKYGIRLPSSHIPCTETKYLRRAAKKMNVDLQEFLDGEKITTFAENNPDWPCYAFVSLFLEWYDETYGSLK